VAVPAAVTPLPAGNVLSNEFQTNLGVNQPPHFLTPFAARGMNILQTPINSISKLADSKMKNEVDRLEQADKLAAEALAIGMRFVDAGGSGGPIYMYYPTQMEKKLGLIYMAQASAIRQSVANELPPDQRQALLKADADEQSGFQMLQSAGVLFDKYDKGYQQFRDAERALASIEARISAGA
jgi:hypothetical protein